MSLRRFHTRVAGAAAVALMVCLGACETSNKPATPANRAAAQDVSALPACRPGDQPLKLLAPSKLSGPAAGSVAAGRVTKAWSVDGGAIRVAPAPAGEKPTVPMSQAACNLLAALTPNVNSIADIATNGSILEYGRLTVSGDISSREVFSAVAPDRPAPAVYQSRPAWILTASYLQGFSCPNMTAWPSPAPTASAALPETWSYIVVAVDASSGRDAITYLEAAYVGCGGAHLMPPQAWVPYESVSVPWRLGSVSADRRSGQIQIHAPACEVSGLNGVVLDSLSPQTQVLVNRSLGRACGPDTWTTVDLYPATNSQLIPQHLIHAPLGPVDLPAA